MAYYDHEHAQILQDRVELLQNAGEAYNEAQVETWAWEVLIDRHPELTPEEAWLGGSVKAGARVQTPGQLLPPAEIGTAHFSAIVNLTYNQLFTFMGTFSNEELNDAQIIAEHHSKGQNFNQTLVNVLVEMREHELQTHDPMPELIWPELYSGSVQAGWEVQTLPQSLPPAEIGTAQQEIPVIISPNKVAALFLGQMVVCAVATALLATAGVTELEKATATQCRTHDWPADAHYIHMDWCQSNGYATK